MSLSPAAGVEEGWPERVLACGVSVRPSLSDEHFIVWFRTAINVTRRPQSFHVSLPQCDSNYIVVCRGRVVAFVKAMSSSSVEVTETASLEARRWNGYLYTSLFSNGNAQPAWARGISYATEWWTEGIRGTYQPLQDAMLETGSKDVCVYMTNLVVPGGSVWIAIWRIPGGLYSYKMLAERQLFMSGRDAVGSLQAELRQVVPGLRIGGKFKYLGLRANPEPQFPRTATASSWVVVGTRAKVEPSPLTRVPKIVRNGSEVIRCSVDSPGVVQVSYGSAVCITVQMPKEAANPKARWSFALSTDGTRNKVNGRATWNGSVLQCAVSNALWASLVEKTNNPWYALQIWTDNSAATLAVPVHKLTDVYSGHGMHSTRSKLMKPCMLLTHDEYVGLPAAVGQTAVIAAAILNASDKLRTVQLGHGSKAKIKSHPLRSEEIRQGVSQIEAASTRAEVLSAFAAVFVPTRKHVAAAFRRLCAISSFQTRLEGPEWSALLASCARRMHRLDPATIVNVVAVLCRCDCLTCGTCCVATPVSPGDNEELLSVIAGLEHRGMASEAKRIEHKHAYGTLRYMVLRSKLPQSVAKAFESRSLPSNGAATFLKLIASEEGKTMLCPEWKTSVTQSLYARRTGAEIWAMANSDKTRAVQLAIPSQRRRIAADLGVLAIQRNAVTLGGTKRWEITPALMTAV